MQLQPLRSQVQGVAQCLEDTKSRRIQRPLQLRCQRNSPNQVVCKASPSVAAHHWHSHRSPARVGLTSLKTLHNQLSEVPNPRLAAVAPLSEATECKLLKTRHPSLSKTKQLLSKKKLCKRRRLSLKIQLLLNRALTREPQCRNQCKKSQAKTRKVLSLATKCQQTRLNGLRLRTIFLGASQALPSLRTHSTGGTSACLQLLSTKWATRRGKSSQAQNLSSTVDSSP